MSWLFVPGSEHYPPGSSWPWRTIARSCTWRGKHTRPRHWRKLTRLGADWIPRLSGLMPTPSTAGPGVVRWISSVRASRASPGAAPTCTSVAPRTSGTRGRPSPASSAKWHPATCSWRTCQGYLFEGLDTYWGPWPVSGSLRNGTCTPRASTARPTSGVGSTCSPPPPPPDRQPYGPESGRWPSPAARDYRSGTGADLARALTRPRTGKPQLAEVVGGPLNPRWVEWLMGLPQGSSAARSCAPSATAWCRWWRAMLSETWPGD